MKKIFLFSCVISSFLLANEKIFSPHAELDNASSLLDLIKKFTEEPKIQMPEADSLRSLLWNNDEVHLVEHTNIADLLEKNMFLKQK
jgi:hypothetical protein